MRLLGVLAECVDDQRGVIRTLQHDALLSDVEQLLGHGLGIVKVFDSQLGFRLAVAIQFGLPGFLLIHNFSFLLGVGFVGLSLALKPSGQCLLEFIGIVVVIFELWLCPQRDRLGLSLCGGLQLGFEFTNASRFFAV